MRVRGVVESRSLPYSIMIGSFLFVFCPTGYWHWRSFPRWCIVGAYFLLWCIIIFKFDIYILPSFLSWFWSINTLGDKKVGDYSIKHHRFAPSFTSTVTVYLSYRFTSHWDSHKSICAGQQPVQVPSYSYRVCEVPVSRKVMPEGLAIGAENKLFIFTYNCY